jgi:hypothetical protein
VDGNGRLIFLFADLGSAGPTQFPVGYFDPNDVMLPADVTANCSGTGSNDADLIYLLDPWTLNQDDPTQFTWGTILDEVLPGTIAHELQHDVLMNERCPRGACTVFEERWLDEALAMVASDLAGFGLNALSERQRMAAYLSTYRDFSLTDWPAAGGDAVGQYGGLHALLRWYLDQATVAGSASAFTRALVTSGLRGKANVAAASGLSFEEGFARFTTAALFSGESFGPKPQWDFNGPSWTPLHSKVGYARYTPLSGTVAAPLAAPLKADGWSAFVTAFGVGAAATVTIASPSASAPDVVVVRFKGVLQQPP